MNAANDNRRQTLDYRRVRALQHCILCDQPKTVGQIACWRCFNACGLRECNPRTEALLCTAEADLIDSDIETAMRRAECGRDWADICLLESRAVAMRSQARLHMLTGGAQ